MIKRAIFTLLVAMAAIPAMAQGITGFCQPDSRCVIFQTDTAALKLTFCSPSVVKVEYAFDGIFACQAPTPAVVSDLLTPMEVNVNEAESLYEIFTGELRVSIDKNPVRIRIYDNYQKLICCDESWRREGSEISCTRTLARDEQIFGLGEKGGEMNRRGGVYTMWNSDKPCYCIDEDPLYKSIPFFISSKRYGVFFDNSYKSTFDFAARKSYTFSAEGGEMIYYIITGEDYKDILGKYIYTDSGRKKRDYHYLSSPFRSSIYLVDPGNQGWLDYFAGQVDNVYAVFDFDGFHIDQLGNRGTRYNANGSKVDMTVGYGKFLQKMKNARSDKKLAFNAVSRYGQANIAAAPSDFLYNEVWTVGFDEIDKIMKENQSLAPSKNTVLAAYMNYKQSGTFNTPAVLLADAVIFALGGSHLELGEHMLCNEYFPNNAMKMSSELQEKLVHYYDFLTGYENLLRGGGERFSPNISSDKVNIAAWGPVKGSVNTVALRVGDRIVIHLLNFAAAKHLDWRDDSHNQAEPPVYTDIDLAIRSSREVKNVWVASPDVDGGVPKSVQWKSSGMKVDVTVPYLQYWTMIVIE